MVPKNHWVFIPEGITKCTDTWCQGILHYYGLVNVSLMCQFYLFFLENNGYLISLEIIWMLIITLTYW